MPNSLMLTDEDLMMEVAHGKLIALSTIFDRYHVALYNFYFRQNRDQSLSEDLTQNVFERMIKYKHTFKSSSNFKAWMFRIARNVNHDHYRASKMKFENEDVVFGLPSKDICIASIMENREQVATLERALNMLNPEYKEVLILTRYEELKYSEVGKIMNCTENLVKVKVHRAMKKLKDIYLKIPQ